MVRGSHSCLYIYATGYIQYGFPGWNLAILFVMLSQTIGTKLFPNGDFFFNRWNPVAPLDIILTRADCLPLWRIVYYWKFNSGGTVHRLTCFLRTRVDRGLRRDLKFPFQQGGSHSDLEPVTLSLNLIIRWLFGRNGCCAVRAAYSHVWCVEILGGKCGVQMRF